MLSSSFCSSLTKVDIFFIINKIAHYTRYNKDPNNFDSKVTRFDSPSILSYGLIIYDDDNSKSSLIPRSQSIRYALVRRKKSLEYQIMLKGGYYISDVFELVKRLNSDEIKYIREILSINMSVDINGDEYLYWEQSSKYDDLYDQLINTRFYKDLVAFSDSSAESVVELQTLMKNQRSQSGIVSQGTQSGIGFQGTQSGIRSQETSSQLKCNTMFVLIRLFSLKEEILSLMPMNGSDKEWMWTKGRTKFGESPTQCALRETEEETGLKLNSDNIRTDLPPLEELIIGHNGKNYKCQLWLYDWAKHKSSSAQNQSANHITSSPITSLRGKVAQNHEADGIQWFTLPVIKTLSASKYKLLETLWLKHHK